MTPKYTVLHKGRYDDIEWLTCHICGEIRSTADPCGHWRIEQDRSVWLVPVLAWIAVCLAGLAVWISLGYGIGVLLNWW